MKDIETLEKLKKKKKGVLFTNKINQATKLSDLQLQIFP